MSSTTRIVSEEKFNVELVDKYLNQINREKFQGLLKIERMQNESWEIFDLITISFGENSIGFERDGISDDGVYIEVVLRNNLAILLNAKLEFDVSDELQDPSEQYATCNNFYEFLKLKYGQFEVDHELRQMRRMIEDFEFWPKELRPLYGLTDDEIQTAKLLIT